MDFFFTIILMFVLRATMTKHGTWKPLSGFEDYIAWFIMCLVAIALVRIPIYLLYYGWVYGPYNPSFNMQIGSGVFAIVFWWAMTYWRIPGCIFRKLKGNR